jgi:phosphate:Na+ symporter
MVQLIALYLAGLSFFFTGVSGISENLRQMSGKRFRVLLARATQHPVAAAMLGAAMGAVTQSTSVVAFILSGMIATGMLSLGRALIVLAFANVGTAVLVFIASVNLQLPTLFLIGICGLLLAFRLMAKFKPAIAGLLSLGLVFFGLDMMKEAFKPLSASSGAMGISNFLSYWPDAAFFIGVLMRTLVHSSSAAGAITITINRGGMLGEFPAMMSMAGLGVGTAVATFLLSSNLRGVPRQIALYQAVTNVAAGVLMALLLIVERATGIPLLMALLRHLSVSVERQMAFMYLLFNLAIAALAGLMHSWAPAWLARMSPQTPEEHLSRPMYLQAEVLLSPETALDLVALEQMRLARAVEQYMDAARGAATVKLEHMHASAQELNAHITTFLESLVNLPISTSLAAQCIAYQRKEETLRALEENVFLFAETLQHRKQGLELAGRLVEALDTILLTALDALQTRQASDVELVVQLTDDRGGMMERLRSRHRLDEGGDVGDTAALHYATTLFERNVWLLRQLGLWMREDARLVAK